MERSARSLLIPGQEYPGQGDVLELVQVAEFVLNGQSLLTRPVEGFTQPSLRDPHPCLQCRDWTHIGGKVTIVQALCLVEQVRERRPDRLEPPVFEPSPRASDTGFAVTRCARPDPGFCSRCCVAACRSLCSR